MRRRPFALSLVAWTFLVWTTRIANIWRDADLDTGEKVGRTGLAASFTVLALVVLVVLWRGSARSRLWAVGALAVWSTAVWVVRDARILAADHEVAFEVVHTVLAAVSIVLSALAWREARRADRAADGDPTGAAPPAPDAYAPTA